MRQTRGSRARHAANLWHAANDDFGAMSPRASPLTEPARPNLLADPPLAKVVARTFEAGARGTLHGITWSAAAYRTDLRDDLQFVASGSGAALAVPLLRQACRLHAGMATFAEAAVSDRPA